MEPLVTVAAAVHHLGVTVAASMSLGGAMVLMGVALVQRGGSRA